MEQLKMTIRALVDHPSRRMIVIIATSVVMLATLWPAADEYFVLSDQRDELESLIVQAKNEVQQLPTLRQQAVVSLEEITRLQQQTVAPDETHEFRSLVAESVRQHQCQLRRLDISGLRERPWFDKDHPLSSLGTEDRGNKTPFELTTQVMTLSITGDLENIEEMLSDMHNQNRFVHARKFSLRSAATGSREVQLDLELVLFHLDRKRDKAS